LTICAAASASRPIVTLCYVQSWDGSITTRAGESLALSGVKSTRLTHHLRILLPIETSHVCIQQVLENLKRDWVASPDIHAQILDNFKAIEDASLFISETLIRTLEEKRRYEFSESPGSVVLF
jgi:hypothetical protein